MNKILALVFHLWIVCGLLVFICFPRLITSYHDLTIDRFAEVEKHCGSVISSASQLKPEVDITGYKLINELSFGYGDWEQEDGSQLLMPFRDIDMPKNSSSFMAPMKLVQFEVLDVDPIGRSNNTVKVLSAFLSLSITRDTILHFRLLEYTEFYTGSSGIEMLGIAFQGIYVESEQNGGERLLCLMGNTSPLPSIKGLVDPYRPLFADDQILLILRYPRIRTLTTREIHGEMISLREESNLKYFDKVRVSSLMSMSEYQFGYERLASKAYSPYTNRDELMEDGVKFSNAYELCTFLRSRDYDVFNIVNNWKCSGTDEYCKLGRSVLGSETIGSINGSFDNVRLIRQNVRCESDTHESTFSNATRVAIVFREISSSAKQDVEKARTGVSSMTLSAEGIWNSSSGELCMIGCVGLGSGSNRCDLRICLYFPHQFSIKQRSFISGSISSIVNGTGSYSTLLLERELHVENIFLMSRYMRSYLSYKYSKIDLAREFLERSQSTNFRTFIRKSLLSYPALEDGEEVYILNRLTEDLCFDVFAVPNPLPIAHPSGTRIQMGILSLGPLFGRANGQMYASNLKQNSGRSEAEATKNQPLNVSAQLQFTENSYNKLSLLSLEGLYNPLAGEMYLICCRDVHGSPKIMLNSNDLEDGRDCLIQAKIQYPHKTARWLITPTVKISITSQRDIDDPLHFSKINLQTTMISYKYHEQLQDIFFRRTFEAIVRILMLSAMVAIILKQLFYIRNQADVIPYVSFTMLLIQANEFVLPLISHAEILFNWKVSDFATDYRTDVVCNLGKLSKALDIIAKLLLAVAIILNIRLFRKVQNSRLNIPASMVQTPRKVINEKHVFVITLVLHVIGFISAHIVLGVNDGHTYLIETERFKQLSGNAIRNLQGSGTKIAKYFRVVQDLFLIPQIIGNFVWQIHGKPLCKSYYIGFTILKLLRYVYDNIRDPIYNHYTLSDAPRIPLRFFSKPDIISIPMTLVGLAMIVYIQQRWNYEKRKWI
ncbi:Protein of unknown function DUF2921 [Macleaya cordata]|uniref:RING-type E3 ubiquitin transferase n=1 Tax=Macleaya cordata TaxID=56857 RepID=A0A200Q7S3_MACCD|nr:Protein of unknown function DUF2921 [Macleaya cordata]